MTREARPHSPTILVVDDEEMVRVSTARMLERRGYRVVTAASPGEALTILRSDAPVDLLISDIVMPEKSTFFAPKVLSGLIVYRHVMKG